MHGMLEKSPQSFDGKSRYSACLRYDSELELNNFPEVILDFIYTLHILYIGFIIPHMRISLFMREITFTQR